MTRPNREAIRMLPAEGMRDIPSLKTQGRTGRRYQGYTMALIDGLLYLYWAQGRTPVCMGRWVLLSIIRWQGGSFAPKNKPADNLAQSFTTSMLAARSKPYLLQSSDPRVDGKNLALRFPYCSWSKLNPAEPSIDVKREQGRNDNRDYRM